jgi:hypothetical protein
MNVRPSILDDVLSLFIGEGYERDLIMYSLAQYITRLIRCLVLRDFILAASESNIITAAR